MSKYEELQRALQHAKQYRESISKMLASNRTLSVIMPGPNFDRIEVPFPSSGPHSDALVNALADYGQWLDAEIARTEAKLAAVEELLKE